MTNPQDLLTQQGNVPGPRAMTLLAEVRTQSSLPFHTVQPPNWAGPEGFGVAAEWSCIMTWEQVTKLQTFLKTNVAPTASTPEALINEAMQALGIGHYLGTFVGQGHGGTEVRMLFAYSSAMAVEDISKTWASLLTNPIPAQQPASSALAQLRKFWNAGTENAEAGLMLLTQLDIDAQLGDPEKFPFGSVDR